jgi:FkbM family methyltransferase
MRGGVFVEAGAYDGVTFSNTLFFERNLGWRGLCVEPQPSAFQKLREARAASTICENVAIGPAFGEAEFIEADTVDGTAFSGLAGQLGDRLTARMLRTAKRMRRYQVPVVTLGSLLEKHGLDKIDYCSIDADGSDLAILETLDFDRFRIDVLTVENNYGDPQFGEVMRASGYEFIAQLQQDEVWKRRG